MPPKRCSSATGWSLRCPLSNPGSLPASALPLSVCFSMYCCFVFLTAPTITERQKSEDSILALSRQFWRISVREGMHSPGAVRNFVIDFINFSQFVQTLFKPRCYHDPCPKGERQSSRKAGKPRLFHFTTPPFAGSLPQEPALFCPVALVLPKHSVITIPLFPLPSAS